jgi:hypothetical protein
MGVFTPYGGVTGLLPSRASSTCTPWFSLPSTLDSNVSTSRQAEHAHGLSSHALPSRPSSAQVEALQPGRSKQQAHSGWAVVVQMILRGVHPQGRSDSPQCCAQALAQPVITRRGYECDTSRPEPPRNEVQEACGLSDMLEDLGHSNHIVMSSGDISFIRIGTQNRMTRRRRVGTGAVHLDAKRGESRLASTVKKGANPTADVQPIPRDHARAGHGTHRGLCVHPQRLLIGSKPVH